MSEFEQIQELRQRVLRSAYDLGMQRTARIVSLEEIAGELQNYMDTSDPMFVDKLAEITIYLGDRGLLKKQASGYELLSITAAGIDKVEGNEPQEAASATSFTFNAPVHGSVIGTHNTAELTNNFDFRSVEAEIEEKGGVDKEELREALEEMRRLLEQGDTLSRGQLSRFSEVMEKHSWFTGSVMQGLLGFATQWGFATQALGG